VTEMVVSGHGEGIDLVRGMIDVAAGRGIPSNYFDLLKNDQSMTDEEVEGLFVPAIGHAIEARIYAEDPLRGFLPSTGPLLQYIEPPNTAANEAEGSSELIRVDSGVTVGSIISPHYDPMISKIIAYSPKDRATAIRALSDALDSTVINGVRHNMSFISDVLRNPDFLDGKTPTNFIDVHYKPGGVGFVGVILNEKERANLAAYMAMVTALRREQFKYPPLTLMEDGVEGEEVIVCMENSPEKACMFGSAYKVRAASSGRWVVCEQDKAGSAVKVENVVIDSFDYHPNNPVVTFQMGTGEKRALQIHGEDNVGAFEVKFNGSDVSVLVMSPEEYKLSRHMKEPKPTDTSNFILSPMPGTLISYAVEDGEHVVAGQEICIIEAMKMQNVLRSSRTGVIRRRAKLGASLVANDLIVEFVSDNIDEFLQ